MASLFSSSPLLLVLAGTLCAQTTTTSSTTTSRPATTTMTTTLARTTTTSASTSNTTTTNASTSNTTTTTNASTSNTTTTNNASTTNTTTTTNASAGHATTTTAVSTWPRANCENPRLTNTQRQLFLDMHNYYRSTLVKGETQRNGKFGIAPPATLIFRLKYDCDAESFAQQAVSTCRRTLLPQYTIGPHKQNLHILNTAQTTVEGAIQNAVVTWWNELTAYGYRTNMMFDPSDKSLGETSNWSKMAWWSNLRVGCAVQHCGTFYATSCMYSPGGNYDYSYVYRVGAVCADCSKCDYQLLCRY